jgi:hypothetical protein
MDVAVHAESRRTLNLVDDILSTYYKCTLSAITHKLYVSRHLLIWKIFLVLLRETLVQMLTAHFSYILYSVEWQDDW